MRFYSPATWLVFCIFAAVVTVSLSAADAAEKRPNVLFVMADDLRTELATYGSAALTPNFDRLAQRSLQFHRAYCQQALCNPSRSSLLTGKRPDTLQLWHNGTHFRAANPNVITLPQWFKEQGYQTRCFGKIFHNWHTTPKGDRPSWSADEFLHYANHGDDRPQVTGPLPANHASAPKCECRDVPDEAYYDGRIAAEAVKFLQAAGPEPWFAAVGFWKPHAPFNAPERYWKLYDREKLPKLDPRRPTGGTEWAYHDGRELRGLPPQQVTFSAAEAAEIRHGYFANISYLDAQLGKVLAVLTERNLWEQTIVVFVGDHGYHLGEHDLWAKTSNFEFDARVPLFVAAPHGRGAGKQTAALVELIDLFPTLTELAGFPSPPGLEGQSLLPLFENPQARVKEAAFTQHPRPAYFDREPSKQPQAMGYSVRTETVRYTEWRDWQTGKPLAVELYDHRHDSQELVNAAEQKELAAEREQAATVLLKQFPPRSGKQGP